MRRVHLTIAAMLTVVLAVGAPIGSAAGDQSVTVALPPGSSPVSLVVGPGGTVFAADARSDAVVWASFDPAPRVDRFLPTLGTSPYSVARTRDGLVFAANRDSDDVSRIDTSRFGIPRRIGLGDGAEPWGLALTPDQSVWVTEIGADRVARIDAGSDIVNATVALPAGTGPKAVVYSRADRRLYVAGSDNGTVLVVDPENGRLSVVLLPPGASPRGIVALPDGGALVTDINLDSVYRIRGTRVTAAIPTAPGAQPYAVAVLPDGTAYVALYGSRQVGVVAPGSSFISRTIAWPAAPYWITSARGRIYTANRDAHSLTRLVPDPTAPRAVTEPVTRRRAHAATLHARLVSGNRRASARFVVARNRGMTRNPRAIVLADVRAFHERDVAKRVRGLRSATRYFVRVEATNDAGTSFGQVRSFRTRRPAR
ncbi:MAG: YncE family protein [Candidatus Nanopelagicales bacterium]